MDALNCGERVIRPAAPRTDRHALAGVVTIAGVPGARRVALFLRGTLELVAVTSSQADGTVKFSGLPEYEPGSLLAVALDDTGACNAVALDHWSQGTP